MVNRHLLYSSAAAAGLVVLLAAWPVAGPQAQQSPPPAVSIDADDIGGVVTGRNGPEAGVWVIAETTELGTRFAKMVVTDDRGRYLIPDLPQANYSVWVRGYGLVDSPRVTSTRGRIVNLTAVPAPNAKAAAEYYPAIYWFSMLGIPDKSLFPGTGPNGNGMPVDYKTQEQWLNAVQLNGCGNCHQLGDKATREIPAALGTFDSSLDAWRRRLVSGPAATSMTTFISRMNTADGGHIKRLAEWTDRIKAGEIPASVPPRPHGVERNLVVTVYDWLSPKYYIHDLALTDRRKPTVNGYGLIYGAAELSTDDSPILDPVRITKTTMRIPIRDQDAPSSALANKVVAPSPYFGTEQVWDTRVNAHNPMLDHEGRVYYTAQHRSPKNPPAYCAAESGHPSAKVYPAHAHTGRVRAEFAPGHRLRSEDEAVLLHRHLFRDSPSQLRRGCGPYAVAQQQSAERAGADRLGQDEAVLGDERRRQVAGVVAAHRGYQRQREARRMGRAQSAGRTGEGQAHRARALRDSLQSASTGRSGARTSPIPAGSFACSPARIRRKRRWRRSTRCRRRASACAASTSIATAWRG